MIIDKKALKILSEYNVLEPDDTPEDDFRYARDKGLMFDPLKQTHEEALSIAFNEFSKCTKKETTDLFLASLSAFRLDWRAGFSAYVYIRTCPKHAFEGHYNCTVCSSVKEEVVDFSFINQLRFSIGGFVGEGSLYQIAFMLKQHNYLQSVLPSTKDFDIFKSIIGILKNANENDSPRIIQKEIRNIKGFKSNEEQRRSLLETLGFCSILETEKHKGFLHQFINLGFAPYRPRSNWQYPVDWWTGKDGINQEALKFWFGDYEPLNYLFD